MTLYLGIDIGTTRTKVACLDVHTGQLVTLRATRTLVDDDPWGGTRDAGAVVDTVTGLLRDVLAHPAVDLDRLAGLSVGSVGEEIVLLDAQGTVTGPVLTWHADHGREAKRGLPLREWEALDDSFSVFKIAWLAQTRPEQLACAVTFTSLADFVAYSILGAKVDGVFLNVSHASRTGLLDLEELTLRGDILHRVGAGHLRLPRLVRSGTAVGSTRLCGSVPRGLPVVAGGHDHWCGAFGAGVREAGDVYISAGTSEAQVMLVDRLPLEVPDRVDVGAFVAGGLRYLHRATPSGRIYQAWRDMLYSGAGDEAMWRDIAALRGTIPPATINVKNRTVQLAPLPLEATPGHAMTSLLAGLAVEAERTTVRLERLAGRPAGDVVVAGLPASHPEWRRLRQEATSRPLRFVSEPEATVVGVALLAQLGVEGTATTPISPTTETDSP